MNKFIRLLGLAIVIICFANIAIAQDSINDYCNCSRPDYHAPVGVMIDHGHAKGEWMVSYRYMNMTMRDNLAGDNKISNEKIYQSYLMSNNTMSMQMHMLMVMYGLSDRITLMGMGSYSVNQMDMSMVMHGGHVHGGGAMQGSMEMNEKSRTSGFGNTKLYLLYSILNDEQHQLLLSAGVNIPTGSISLYGTNMMDVRQKFTYSMQTGTGSWGILPGITYTGKNNNYSWGIQMISDMQVNSNKAGYKFGNELTSNTWIARKWNSWMSNSLRVSTNNIGRIKGFDPAIASFRTTDPDADTNNSGSFNSSINVGLNIAIPEGFLTGNRFGIEYGIPFYQNVNGIQMKKQGFLFAGWQISF